MFPRSLSMILLYIVTNCGLVSGRNKLFDNVLFSRFYADTAAIDYFDVSLKQCVEKCYDHGLDCAAVSYRRQRFECHVHRQNAAEPLRQIAAGWIYLPVYGTEDVPCYGVVCPDNHYCNRQFKICQVTCPAGQYWSASIKGCQPCDVDFYQDNANGQYNEACIQCPLRTNTVTTGTTSATHCIGYCPPGRIWNFVTGDCEDCPVGTYTDRNDGLGKSTCRPCPTGRTTSILKWGSIRDCDTQLFMETPDFVSDWIQMSSGTYLKHDVEHGLGEVPLLVDVQIKSSNPPNEGFIFQGIGHAPGDDDFGKYGGVIYVYNNEIISLMPPKRYNNYPGFMIYTGNPSEHVGPNFQESTDAMVRVRAWKALSLPPSDFSHTQWLDGSSTNLSEVYVDVEHNFGEYPAFVISRTRLESTQFPMFYADTMGSSFGQPADNKYATNGIVISGYDTRTIKAWTCSFTNRCKHVWRANDGYYSASARTGTFEVYAWKQASLAPTTEQTVDIDLTMSPVDQTNTLNIVVDDGYLLRASIQSLSQLNPGFRFYGGGGYSDNKNTFSTCIAGGLFYGFRESTLRFWRSGDWHQNGALVCIPSFLSLETNTGPIMSGHVLTQVWKLEHGSCRQNPCRNGGTCLNDQGAFVCHCTWEWTGDLCDIPANTGDRYCDTFLVSGPFGVADDQLTASSSWHNLYHTPNFARLHQGEIQAGTGAWSLGGSDLNPYIQVDFRRQHLVETVYIQGRGSQIYLQYVTSYQVQYSLDCSYFHQVVNENNDVVTFPGNTDTTSVVKNPLPTPVLARCVRIKPLTWEIHCSLRFDVSGCF